MKILVSTCGVAQQTHGTLQCTRTRSITTVKKSEDCLTVEVAEPKASLTPDTPDFTVL